MAGEASPARSKWSSEHLAQYCGCRSGLQRRGDVEPKAQWQSYKSRVVQRALGAVLQVQEWVAAERSGEGSGDGPHRQLCKHAYQVLSCSGWLGAALAKARRSAQPTNARSKLRRRTSMTRQGGLLTAPRYRQTAGGGAGGSRSGWADEAAARGTETHTTLCCIGTDSDTALGAAACRRGVQGRPAPGAGALPGKRAGRCKSSRVKVEGGLFLRTVWVAQLAHEHGLLLQVAQRQLLLHAVRHEVALDLQTCRISGGGRHARQISDRQASKACDSDGYYLKF